MSGADRKLNVAIVQDSPVFGDLAGSLAKAIGLAERAAEQGARLICFGETWLPGYPIWLDVSPGAGLWGSDAVKDLYASLRDNSVVVGGEETKLLGETARRLGAAIVIGINERVDAGPGHGTLYNSIVGFDESGVLVLHHRKLVPTYTERIVWGPGDADGLRCAVLDGVRVGAMVCWEHWMPLTRQHLHLQGEQVHIALWPTVHEMHQVASRHYAFEGRCFVLAVGQVLRASALPASLPAVGEDQDALLLRGGSAIIAPDGRYVVAPLFDEAGLITAELDLREIDREVMTLDVSGHYARPDLFELRVKTDSRRG